MSKVGITQRIASGWLGIRNRFWGSETAVMLTFAIVVGLGSGLGTIVFVNMIRWAEVIFLDGGSKVFGFMGNAFIIVIPLIGGLLVGPIVHFLAPEAKGHGVPEVMTAIATRRGRIRPVVVLAKALGSAITIGSGGSVGREGPIVQIGSALGSTIGQYFKLNDRRVINLVACGAAGGIAATFNAPIAGVMFALEVILLDFSIQTFSTIVISAVTASVVSQAVLGNNPAFVVPKYSMVSAWELLLYVGLGVAAAFGGLLFMKLLHFFEDRFDAWKFPPYLKPAVGGLGLGILGYFLPNVLGTGFQSIGDALNGNVGFWLLFILVFGKILATSLTLGSGSSGGVFAPALFTGAVLGGAYGQLANMLFPTVTAASGAYAMVGMAALFAGVARAPITAIIILFEMTQDYRIILPLMFATVISIVISRHLEPESIYTFKLKRRGIDVRAKKDINLMRAILVNEAMTPIEAIQTVPPDMSITELGHLFQETSHHGFIVLNPNRELCGVVTISDLEQALVRNTPHMVVSDICTKNVLSAFHDDTLDDALHHFGALDVGRIPVVDRLHSQRVVGVLRRADIVRAYSSALVDKQQRDEYLERLRLEAASGVHLHEIQVRRGDRVAGKRLKDLVLPADCIIGSIWHGGRAIVPHGRTRLMVGDRLVLFARDEEMPDLQQFIHEGMQED